MVTPKKFLQLFLERRLLSEEQLSQALEIQRRDNRFVGTIVVE